MIYTCGTGTAHEVDQLRKHVGGSLRETVPAEPVRGNGATGVQHDHLVAAGWTRCTSRLVYNALRWHRGRGRMDDRLQWWRNRTVNKHVFSEPTVHLELSRLALRI